MNIVSGPQVVISGCGRNFCAGIDLAYLQDMFKRLAQVSCPGRMREQFRRHIMIMQVNMHACMHAKESDMVAGFVVLHAGFRSCWALDVAHFVREASPVPSRTSHHRIASVLWRGAGCPSLPRCTAAASAEVWTSSRHATSASAVRMPHSASRCAASFRLALEV